nr:MAG: hypothetical protein EDM05_10175 [Leptolyngbya sp. IPPAS B-1204]
MAKPFDEGVQRQLAKASTCPNHSIIEGVRSQASGVEVGQVCRRSRKRTVNEVEILVLSFDITKLLV